MDPYNRLLARKQELEQMTGTLQERLMTPLAETTDELSLYDQHPADIGSEVFEREKDRGILELMQLELEKVHDALNKYEQGRYGVCEVCGQAIEPARLDRMVNTTLCVGCARQRQDSFRRPAEEEVLIAGDMSDRGETFQVAGYEYFESGDGSSSG
ncbi:MAG: TraR/DksA C4-type zinc finger protein [Syntrophomonadaceae bacterium]|nr:TraR/DksA C4-type zinc finger protein [Syntrophomonadaceae bacterium]